ncbi:hypothetical protein CRENBAI_004814 [Crenichthys baileyi]|uniref:Uncharacterized protein n=1 Tax=Crenichthys baileyi TaxID=28760 RepID=A0AAV9QMQ8_9TELE
MCRTWFSDRALTAAPSLELLIFLLPCGSSPRGSMPKPRDEENWRDRKEASVKDGEVTLWRNSSSEPRKCSRVVERLKTTTYPAISDKTTQSVREKILRVINASSMGTNLKSSDGTDASKLRRPIIPATTSRRTGRTQKTEDPQAAKESGEQMKGRKTCRLKGPYECDAWRSHTKAGPEGCKVHVSSNSKVWTSPTHSSQHYNRTDRIAQPLTTPDSNGPLWGRSVS